MKKLIQNRYIQFLIYLVIGILLGWLLFKPAKHIQNQAKNVETKVEKTIWTCSMHPQIRKEAPGKCPICAMDLIPLQNGEVTGVHETIKLSKEAAELANIQTSSVERKQPVMETRLYGKIQVDERNKESLVAHFSGRVEKLWVNFTGEKVSAGQKLAEIYSPELVTAQQELLEAIKVKASQPEIYQAAREKLLQWKLSAAQISKIETTGQVVNIVNIEATTSGIVLTRKISAGDYVSEGTILFEIADLSKVWVMFDAYENDIPHITEGNTISFTVQALPGKEFSGKINYIDPVIDPITRIAKIRTEINNSNGLLKPEMFVTGNVKSDFTGNTNALVIPKSAVLWTGKRSVVYVKVSNSDEPEFSFREINTGEILGNYIVVLQGLKEGEEVVTNGAFSIDAAAQLEGKQSMMSMEPIKASNSKESNIQKTETPKIKPETQTVTFKVFGNCDLCKERIENAALSVQGIKKALWNVETKFITVTFNPGITSLKTIHRAIAKAGHDTDSEKAPDNAYNSLPECCLYRK